MTDQLLDIKVVMELVSIKKTALYGLISTGRFPPPLKISPRCSRWRRSDIQAWIDGLPSKEIAA